MELDRQAIERRDFPIVRRGYDPATVDAHLRALAGEIEELRRQAGGSGRDSLAAVAGAQVQGILEAAQATAQAIESEAAERAARLQAETDTAAHATREQAIATARERIAAVTQATEALLQRIGSMDGETRTLVESLRGGAGRLAGDLDALSAEMSGLYDAAAGRTPADAPPPVAPEPDAGSDSEPDAGSDSLLEPEPEPEAVFAPAADATPPPPAPVVAAPSEQQGAFAPNPVEPPTQTSPPAAPAPLRAAPAPPPVALAPPPGDDDLDGARLVALNMALNGDSREATGRYLAENFAVPDPEQLLDEVYAAIEA